MIMTMMKRQRKIKNSTNFKCLNVIPMLFIPLIRIRISFRIKMDSKETYDEGNIVILNEFKVSKPVPSNSTSDASNNEHLSKSKFEQPAKKIELEDQSDRTRKLNETIKKLEKDIQKRTQQLNQITNGEDEDSQKQAKIQKLNQIINDSNNEFKVSKLVPSNSKLDASDDEHVYKSEVEQPAKKIKLDDQGDKIRKLNEIIKKLEKDVQKRTRKLNQISNDFKEDSQKQAEIQKLNQIIKNLEKDIERKTQKLNQITNDLNEKA